MIKHLFFKGKQISLERALSCCLGKSISIRRGFFGKPYAEGVVFNFSHKDDLTVLALSDQLAVGVDLERKEAEIVAISKCLHSNESVKDVVWYFTVKEAIVKALGCGLTLPLSSIDLLLHVRKKSFSFHGIDINIRSLKGYWLATAEIQRENLTHVKQYFSSSQCLDLDALEVEVY